MWKRMFIPENLCNVRGVAHFINISYLREVEMALARIV